MITHFFFFFCVGKKAKSSTISIDHDLADGLVDLEKLKTNMESAVSKLQLDFRDKVSTKILPSKSWHMLKVIHLYMNMYMEGSLVISG